MKLRDDTSDKTPTIKPEKFAPAKWRDFAKAFPMYLSGFKGAQHATLDYIIRPNIDAGHVHANSRVESLYDHPLTGRHYTKNNHKVYRLLANPLSDSEGMSWIEEFETLQNGRAA